VKANLLKRFLFGFDGIGHLCLLSLKRSASIMQIHDARAVGEDGHGHLGHGHLGET
jgi:hypothetical protein